MNAAEKFLAGVAVPSTWGDVLALLGARGFTITPPPEELAEDDPALSVYSRLLPVVDEWLHRECPPGTLNTPEMQARIQAGFLPLVVEFLKKEGFSPVIADLLGPMMAKVLTEMKKTP